MMNILLIIMVMGTFAIGCGVVCRFTKDINDLHRME